MSEPIERLIHRITCPHYGINDHCALESKNASFYGNKYGFPHPQKRFMDIPCTEDSKCSRMKKFDRKLNLK